MLDHRYISVLVSWLDIFIFSSPKQYQAKFRGRTPTTLLQRENKHSNRKPKSSKKPKQGTTYEVGYLYVK